MSTELPTKLDAAPERQEQKPERYFNRLASSKFRNDPCPCGSHKKVKKCHGQSRTVSLDEFNAINAWVVKWQLDMQKALNDNTIKDLEMLTRID
jgi:hypothetical protein